MLKSWNQKSIDQEIAEAQARMQSVFAAARITTQTNIAPGACANPNSQLKDESREIRNKYDSGFDIITKLTDDSLKLYTQANTDILSHLLSSVPAAFKGGSGLADLPREIKNINGLYQERDLVFSEINTLRNDITTSAKAIRACTQLDKADQLAAELQTQYNNKVSNIKTHITNAAEDIAQK